MSAGLELSAQRAGNATVEPEQDRLKAEGPQKVRNAGRRGWPVLC